MVSEGYSILRPLGDGRTLLARDASGRQVVLKPLPGDCLLGRQLHPSVRLRLQRIRELADAGVANCHGLVRMPDGDFLVWEHVAGQSIDESSPDPAWLARELPLAVRTLHVRGLVHGALHGRNVLIDGSGRLRLTHLSPLLYDDPAVDERAVEQLLQARRGARDAEAPATVARVRSTDPMRRRAAIAAVAVTVGAVGLAWWVVRVAHRAATTDPVPPPTRAGDWVAQ